MIRLSPRAPDSGPVPRLGLTRLTIAASGLLALLIGVAFAVLMWAIADANSSTSARRASRSALVEAGNLEQLVLDLETGQRGFVITKREEFLEPWQRARREFPEQERRFTETATSPSQRRIAEQIRQGVDSLVNDYSVPLVEAVRRRDATASGLAATAEGKRRVDALRARFDQYTADERAELAAREDAAGSNARRAVIAAGAGLAATTALVAGFTVLQHRAVVRPVRGVAAAAGRLAGGDLGVRIAPSKVAEIGALGTSFNTMAASLQDSRRRIMESVEAVHRRTARDLHDGAQQRLVSLMIGLRLARELVPETEPAATELMDQSIAHAQEAIDELRELARGIYPLVLTVKGLEAAVRELASRCPVPTVVDSDLDRRIGGAVESNAYFVVAEAVTNAVKHAQASQIDISLELGEALRIRVADDGVGGVGAGAAGSGLTGLADRVAAFDGTLTIESPPGGGTTILARIPVP
ncbi:CHASE3 domain-containing protein [Nonomuraea gerenzanensis]|uniref:histidine kinase n=1 Tax=Nonomuraea gerenzanensis TaxID=93944 RepID=A0A1M4EB08_9ACTN|nr:CHASE3 domain-containing protein [Nonomuraea gerenzanensis]UBU18269.1 CHASE3 domain-containing protein [Nonomuraea gerenzanensis]SBO96085.1 putative two-component system sensor kinase [Nonomuraea gerenzanensis]